MSYVIAAPDTLAAASADVAGIGSSLSEASGAAAASTTRVIAAGDDEVSAAIASLFSSHGKAFQALSAQAAAFHPQIVQALNAGAGAHASTEAANVGPLQTLAQDLPDPNVAVSVGGFTLLRLGSATASSDPLGEAIAWGANSDAKGVTGGISTTVAIGTNSLAETGPGTLNVAIAFGTNSVAYSGYGNNIETATAIGAHSTADAVNGFLNLASAVGTGSTAVAGGPGGNNEALVLGIGSTADAGASLTTAGQGDLAIAVGNMLDAAATGTNQLVNIVFQP